MKKLFLLFATLFFFANSYSQDKDRTFPKIVGDTLFTTSGYKIVEKQDIKIGTGSMPDGDFKFVRINSASWFAYHSNTGYNGFVNQANSFSRSQSGLNYKIKSIEKRRNKKHGYVYYAKIGSGIINYEIDVENAIASGELNVPDEFKPKTKTAVVVEVKQQVSVADELAKLKKLSDDGILTQEEYEAQKKKLLEKN
jgi:Short C-terminal domain